MILLVFLGATALSAWTASGLVLLSVGEDLFYNHDFVEIHEPINKTKCDWPVNMLFWHNANIDKVKNDIYWDDAGWRADWMYLRLDDGSGMIWDQDKGTKSWGVTTVHMRLYAADGYRMYMPPEKGNWGYYVLGTAHYDKYEGTPWHKHGWSEDAEAELSQIASNNGYSVAREWANFYNAEEDRWEGNHFWQNSGKTSAVYIP